MSKEHNPATLTTTGTGVIQVPPDEAIVHLSVITEAKTAVEASQRNATLAQAVKAAVEAQPNHGVTTSGLSVRPVTTWDPQTHTHSITGFRATNEVSVRTKPGYAGQVFDAGIEAGANQSSGIEFRIQNERPHREEALRIAVKEAMADANVVATAADVTIDGVETIDVDPGAGRVVQAKMLRAEASTPVEPDDLDVRAGVRIVCRIRAR